MYPFSPPNDSLAVSLKSVLFCAFSTISVSARLVSLDSVLRVWRLSSSSLTARVFLVTFLVVYRRISFGASGMVETRSPTW